MTYRTGRSNPHTIYAQDGPDPSDTDTFVGSARTAHMAHTLVDAANLGERFREHSQTLNKVAWRLASALGDIPADAEEHQGDIDDLLERTVAVLENNRTSSEST